MKFKMNIKGILIVIILILGVLFINNLNTFREGAEEMSAEQAQSFSGDLSTTINQKFEAAGLPTVPPAETAKLMQQLMDLMEKEVAQQRARSSSGVRAIIAGEGSISPAGLTVAPTIIDNSFFSGNKFSDPFCATYSGTKLSEQCAALTEDSCNLTDCCVYVNGTKCMAGNARGPTSNSGLDNPDTDYYLYKYQCYGNCTNTPPTSILGSGKAVADALAASARTIANTPSGSTDPCGTDNQSTIITQECLNKLWKGQGCKTEWTQIPKNTGMYLLPNTIFSVDTTKKNLFVQMGTSNVVETTNQTLQNIKDRMPSYVKRNPNLCTPSSPYGR
jgi:hypothetical protein